MERPAPSSSPGERGEIERLRGDLAAARAEAQDARGGWQECAAKLARALRDMGEKGIRAEAAEASLSRVRGETLALAKKWEAKAALFDEESAAPTKNDDERRTALAKFVVAIALRDAARDARSLASSAPGDPAEPARDDGARTLPCGCIRCICDDDLDRCHGCGAKLGPGCHVTEGPVIRHAAPGSSSSAPTDDKKPSAKGHDSFGYFD
jgi:hypothetical protein